MVLNLIKRTVKYVLVMVHSYNSRHVYVRLVSIFFDVLTDSRLKIHIQQCLVKHGHDYRGINGPRTRNP